MAAVFTIGYENRTPDQLVEVLRTAGVTHVVDVRELANSRRPGFSKRLLSESLERAGITYEHRRELGTPKPIRELYRRGELAGGRDAVRAHLASSSDAALRGLAESLTLAKTCLLCREEDPAHCHRSVIVELLKRQQPRLRVTHL